MIDGPNEFLYSLTKSSFQKRYKLNLKKSNLYERRDIMFSIFFNKQNFMIDNLSIDFHT